MKDKTQFLKEEQQSKFSVELKNSTAVLASAICIGLPFIVFLMTKFH